MNDLPPDPTAATDLVVEQRLRDIYGTIPSGLGAELMAIVDAARRRRARSSSTRGETAAESSTPPLWDETDSVLITYADQIRDPGRGSPLAALRQFLCEHQLDQLFGVVHLLPFCPWTSDDGFSVVDYLQVAAEIGRWEDVAELGRSVDLMFDLVLNHCSQQHAWFQSFLRGEAPYDRYFIAIDPSTDVSAVVRPRSSPLLTPFETARGTRYVWTTFSGDQVDLNYAEPRVLVEMARTFVEYALRGARIIRLDAVAFLWKDPTTSSLHLPQTHAIVRLLRRLVDLAVPGTIVLTETNVPHRENISYFGDGDEAHMVYQFSLPPLLLDAMESGDTAILTQWLASLQPPTAGTTFFNFTASHDGIGVRPLEGLVPEDRFEAVVRRVRRHGGKVSMRSRGDGSEAPYELNITYLDAVADPQLPASERTRRFMTTQAFAAAMQGVPAFYFQSLVGGPSDREAVETTGHNRAINRHKYSRQELETRLAKADTPMGQIFREFRQLLAIRRRLPALHPGASQRVLSDLPDGCIGWVRGDEGRAASPLTVLCNLGSSPAQVPVTRLPAAEFDFLSGQTLVSAAAIELQPYQIRWVGASEAAKEGATVAEERER